MKPKVNVFGTGAKPSPEPQPQRKLKPNPVAKATRKLRPRPARGPRPKSKGDRPITVEEIIQAHRDIDAVTAVAKWLLTKYNAQQEEQQKAQRQRRRSHLVPSRRSPAS